MTVETIEDFYKGKFNWMPENLQKDMGHFNVFKMEDCIGPNAKNSSISYNRRNYYKISMMRGSSTCHYADKSIDVSGCTLMFFNSKVPYAWDNLTEDRTGYFCIFTEEFFTDKMRGGLNELPIYQFGGNPFYKLNTEQEEYVCSVFEKMLTEIGSDYIYKYDLLRNYVTDIIHYALKTQPGETSYRYTDAKSRITAVFTELLERQFPIETPNQRFSMRSANDFANQLAVHVNHLNRAIRETTGQTTTDRIAERLLSEAKSLLRHTDWNISEIAYSLGFEEPTHFNNFFKKKTALTPSSFRNV
ncbi:helix-turn-helix domain-containing protein [Mucilaginibacter agri]|uniref:Helix-turn-helix domain-containing protein n=1 Tax=Mucilaginibacter agri TaxID=2695265 RepID=A0A965ZKX7_9SPHI|nr:helix-turn-helix transcriptional regulator [Mucilaginibacter agri]NCD71864.1 helix-turn-helix domain-containing protein [Mucilaginibacter agri]